MINYLQFKNKRLKTNPYTNSLNTTMEQLKIISTILPFGAFLAIDDTEYMEDLNSNLITWVKKHKPKSYRIINVAVQEVSHQEAMLYMMFVAYE